MEDTDIEFINKQYSNQEFPTFQYSVFIGSNKEEQIVIRSNNAEDFEQLVTYVRKKYPPKIPQNATETALPWEKPVQDVLPYVCPIHNKQFIWSKYPSKFTGKKYLYHYNDEGAPEKTCYEEKVRKQSKPL